MDTPARKLLKPQLPTQRQLFYDGQWHAPQDQQFVDTINPATNKPITAIASANAKDAELAIAAAKKAFPAWRDLKPTVRGSLLRQAAGVLREHAEELAMLDALNTGNPVAEMVKDVETAADGLEFFGGVATEAKGETIPFGPDYLNYTLREPLGVIARVVAYNHPLMFAAMKIGAPLAAGNTIVMKLPEQAPLSGIRMAELLGGIFPPGVLNVLSGARACGQALATHPDVAKISLIGGVETGKAVMRTAADSLKPVLLELGGKNALIAYPDADPERLLEGIVKGMNFFWAGQSCGSTSRVFLHESIHDTVLARLPDAIRSRHQPGIPTDWNTTMGPLISQAQLDKVMQYIALGISEGARLVTGGSRCTVPQLADGFFVEPTVFADVKHAMRIAREEIFGPVLAVLRWNDEEDLFRTVNDVNYGLTASIWTRDIAVAHRAAARVQSGYVWINNASTHFPRAPFGGYKQSGLGREECFEELLEFTQIKNVNVTL